MHNYKNSGKEKSLNIQYILIQYTQTFINPKQSNNENSSTLLSYLRIRAYFKNSNVDSPMYMVDLIY